MERAFSRVSALVLGLATSHGADILSAERAAKPVRLKLLNWGLHTWSDFLEADSFLHRVLSQPQAAAHTLEGHPASKETMRLMRSSMCLVTGANCICMGLQRHIALQH